MAIDPRLDARETVKKLLAINWRKLKERPYRPRAWFYFTLGCAAFGLATLIRMVFGYPTKR